MFVLNFPLPGRGPGPLLHRKWICQLPHHIVQAAGRMWLVSWNTPWNMVLELLGCLLSQPYPPRGLRLPKQLGRSLDPPPSMLLWQFWALGFWHESHALSFHVKPELKYLLGVSKPFQGSVCIQQFARKLRVPLATLQLARPRIYFAFLSVFLEVGSPSSTQGHPFVHWAISM